MHKFARNGVKKGATGARARLQRCAHGEVVGASAGWRVPNSRSARTNVSHWNMLGTRKVGDTPRSEAGARWSYGHRNVRVSKVRVRGSKQRVMIVGGLHAQKKETGRRCGKRSVSSAVRRNGRSNGCRVV